MQVVGSLRQKDAVIGIVIEELAVGIEAMEGEISARPLEILAPRKSITKASVQRNEGRKSQRGIDPNDGSYSHEGRGPQFDFRFDF